MELLVTPEQAGRTVKSLLKGELGLSTARIARLKRTETGLTVNGVRVFTSAVLRAGDRLAVDLPAAERPTAVRPAAMELDVRWEDEHLLILNKSAPLAVIPSSLSPGEPTLAEGLAHYLGPGFSFHPVNRLDRGTTGLMAVAKNGWVHDRLRRQLHGGGFTAGDMRLYANQMKHIAEKSGAGSKIDHGSLCLRQMGVAGLHIIEGCVKP